MKRVALIFIVALVPLPLSAQRRTPTPIPSPSPTAIPRVHHYRKHVDTPTPSPTPETKGVIVKQGMVCRTKQQDLELRDWIGGLIIQVHEAQGENASAQKTNADTITTLGMSVKDAAALISECAADKACSKAPLSCWFHRLIKHILWIAGGIVVLLIILVVINVVGHGVLTPVLDFCVSIWKWILGLFTRKPPAPPTV